MNLKSLFFKNSRWWITEKMFLSLMLAEIVVELSLAGSNLIDGLIVGRFLGSMDLAAEGLSFPIFSIIGVISGLLAIGMQVTCTKFVGIGNLKDVSRYFSITIYFGMLVSLVMTFLVMLFAEPLADFFSASSKVVEMFALAAQYMRGLATGIPAMILVGILGPALLLDSGRKTVQIGAIIGMVSNIVMDIVAVRFGWGLFGVGLATAVSNYMNLFYMIVSHLSKENRILHFVRPNVSIKEFLFMLGSGTEKASMRLANTFRSILLNRFIIAVGGAAAMSAFSARNNFSDFSVIAGAGIASAVSFLTGLYYGEINKEAIEEVDAYKNKLVFFLVLFSLPLFVFSRQVAGLYVSDDDHILELASFAIKMLALQLPLKALIDCRIKYLQGINCKFNMNALILGNRFLSVVVSAYVCGKMFGVYGILASYTVGDIISLVSVYVYYAVKNHKLFPLKDDYLNLPDKFNLSPMDVISLDIYDMHQISLGSEQIMMFAKGHGADDMTSYSAALAFEELGNNIIKHGFPKNKSHIHLIDLRVVITENDFVIRISDNCPEFDVTKLFAEINAENANLSKNIGIRIVSRIASNISSLHIFETNNVIIHI